MGLAIKYGAAAWEGIGEKEYLSIVCGQCRAMYKVPKGAAGTTSPSRASLTDALVIMIP